MVNLLCTQSLSLIGTSFEFTDQMSINIESLTILRSKVKGLESLNSQKKLTELSLSFLQKVNNLDLIREVKSLKKLTINTVKVSHLPNFTKLDSLKGIYLENIGKVNNLDIIASASNLEEFVFYNAKEYEASDFLFLNDMKVLQKVIIDLNSEKKMNELNSFLKIKK